MRPPPTIKAAPWGKPQKVYSLACTECGAPLRLVIFRPKGVTSPVERHWVNSCERCNIIFTLHAERV